MIQERDPADEYDHTITFDGDGLDEAETITSSQWSVSPSGPGHLVIGTGPRAPTHLGQSATVWLSGGTAGTRYRVSCRITTSANPSRTFERSIRLDVKEL